MTTKQKLEAVALDISQKLYEAGESDKYLALRTLWVMDDMTRMSGSARYQRAKEFMPSRYDRNLFMGPSSVWSMKLDADRFMLIEEAINVF